MKRYVILNYMFGWDYVFWKNTMDQGISRVIVLCDKRIGYWRYGISNVFDEIKKPEDVFWLTCPPDKYFKQ